MATTQRIRIGTRGSDLALYQARFIAKLLEDKDIDSDIIIIKTTGDKDLRPLKNIAGDGFFTRELERALIQDQIDIAVHSSKDLPSMLHRDLPWIAIGPRESSSDIIVIKNSQLDADGNILAGTKIGTSSERRKAQIEQHYKNAQICELRGNVPSRLNKVIDGELDAVVLAEAGLKRLGLLEHIDKQKFSAIVAPWVTAPCQGMIAVQSTQNQLPLLELLSNRDLCATARAEKSLLSFLGGGCHLSVGCKVEKADMESSFSYFYKHHDGNILSNKISKTSIGACIQQSFQEIALGLSKSDNFTPKSRVYLTHSLSQQLKVAQKLIAKSYLPIFWPLIDVRSHIQRSEIEKLNCNNNTAVVFTSQNAARLFVLEYINAHQSLANLQQARIYSIGSSTAEVLSEMGLSNILLPEDQNAKSLTELLKKDRAHWDKIILPASLDSKLIGHLNKNELPFEFIETYATYAYEEALTESIPSEGNIILFASPSSVRFAIARIGLENVQKLKCYAIGNTTGEELEKYKIQYTLNPKSGDWNTLLSLIE